MKIILKKISIILFIIPLIYGCSESDNPDTPEENTSNEIVYEPIYYFKNGHLKSLNLNNEGGLSFLDESENELTNEIYSIAYDPSDGTFFGTTHYSSYYTSQSSFESYNPVTKERIKRSICDCRHHSVTVNTSTNRKILIKYGNNTYEKVIFQEISSNGDVIFESQEIDLGGQVSKFIYVPNLNAFVAKEDNYNSLKISLIDANSYNLQTLVIDVDYPNDYIGSNSNYNSLNFDKENNILYSLRSNGLYTININSESAEKIETNWIEFFQSEFGTNEELNLVKTIYYPPTNEIIISGNGFFGSSSGNNKFFAIDLTTKQAREINSDYHYLYRVYGFATKN